MSAPEHGRRFRDWARGLLACGIALGLGSLTTLASWTTGDAAEPAPLAAGQLDVVVDSELASLSELDATMTQAAWQVDDLLPGEVVSFTFEVSNTGDGTIPFDLRFGGYVTPNLASTISLDVFEGGAPSEQVALTAPVEYRDVSCSGGTLVGSGAPGTSAATANPYLATKREIAVGASVTYCVQLTVSNSTATQNSTTLPNVGTQLVFLFRGTQEGAP